MKRRESKMKYQGEWTVESRHCLELPSVSHYTATGLHRQRSSQNNKAPLTFLLEPPLGRRSREAKWQKQWSKANRSQPGRKTETGVSARRRRRIVSYPREPTPSQPSSPVTRQLHQRCQTPPPSCLSSSSSSHPALHHLKKRQHLLLCTGKE